MNDIPTPLPASEPPYLEQYKAYIADLGNIGSRYATSMGFHLSVITALLGILALKQAGAALSLAVSAFAILVCVIWWQNIVDYRKLFRLKFEVLREIERAGNLFPIYAQEDKLRGKTSLLANDKMIPVVLSLPFVVTFILNLCKLSGIKIGMIGTS